MAGEDEWWSEMEKKGCCSGGECTGLLVDAREAIQETVDARDVEEGNVGAGCDWGGRRR